jgi:hypothetical protein
MSSSLFIISVSCYLFSIVASLLLSFFYKSISIRVLNVIIMIHFLIGAGYLFFAGDQINLTEPGFENYLFLFFFCSGAAISGLILRNKYHPVLKLYFFLFLLSIIAFLFAPSKLLGFIASGKTDAFRSSRFHLTENYYLVGQNHTALQTDEVTIYKLVREMGFFHKTLSRDIIIPEGTDSVRLIGRILGTEITVRTYQPSYNKTDSSDISISLIITRDSTGVISRKLK